MPPSTLEFDFGLSNLFEGSQNVGNTNSLVSGLSDYGSSGGNGATAADYLSLSNLFDSFGGNGSNASSAVAPSSWQTKKTMFEQQQQQQQQQQQEQNSLNALLSQHVSQSVHNPTGAATNATPNPFAFSTREELESLAASASANSSSSVRGDSGSTVHHNSYASVQMQQQTQNSNLNTSTANINFGNSPGINNYMFVATIVDPNQEDAPPQQMLFLPGSNQVIPMPSSLSLANLPVVFPQGSLSSAGSTNFSFALPSTAEFTNNNTVPNWPVLQTQQLQQSQQVFTLNNFPSASNNNLVEDAHLEFSSLGLSSAEQVQHQQMQQLPVFAGNKVVEANSVAASTKAMPVRPLSAYNFFFSDERDRILQNKTDETDVYDNAKKQGLLVAHLAKDRSKRRPHRKTHGKINFTTLSKLIGQRWKQLPDDRKNFYREVAAIDLERYQRELRERSSPNGALAASTF